MFVLKRRQCNYLFLLHQRKLYLSGSIIYHQTPDKWALKDHLLNSSSAQSQPDKYGEGRIVPILWRFIFKFLPAEVDKGNKVHEGL